MDTIKITNPDQLPGIITLLEKLEKQVSEIKPRINESMSQIDVDDWYLLVEDIEETVEEITAKGMRLIRQRSVPMSNSYASVSEICPENAV